MTDAHASSPTPAFYASLQRAFDHLATNPRHGFDLLYATARHQKQPWGKTVLWRVYCELRMSLPKRGKKRLPARIRQPLQAASQPN